MSIKDLRCLNLVLGLFVVSRTFLTQDCPGLVRTFLVRTFLVAPQLKTRAVTFF